MDAERWGVEYEIVRLCDRPELKQRAALWFSEKWSVPLAAYQASIDACLRQESPVPQWYLAVDGRRIIGGLGVIDNDFHDRKDLAPNVCAVYTEPGRRGQGVAGALLNYVCADMRQRGVDTLYLITEHSGFYERYGWEFHCLAQGDGEPAPSRVYIHR